MCCLFLVLAKLWIDCKGAKAAVKGAKGDKGRGLAHIPEGCGCQTVRSGTDKGTMMAGMWTTFSQAEDILWRGDTYAHISTILRYTHPHWLRLW